MTNERITRKPYATIVALVVVAIFYLTDDRKAPQRNLSPALLESAQERVTIDERNNGQMVESVGIVDRVLPDDTVGSKHQRFILKLSDGKTLLIAHNIDLARRIDNLQHGDSVKFRGQYETNDRGGVVHWTHDDPRGDHPAGWLEHNGKQYR